MSPAESLTLAQLRGLDALNPRWARAARRMLAEDGPYEQFVEVLYEDIDDCVRRIEEDPKVHQFDSEDRLSREIINMLGVWYDASHDELIGGHSDIVVRGPRGFLWVGEAKIHGAYDYMLKGFQQLATRYLRGNPLADQGALLMYIKNEDCASVVKKWAKKLAGENLDGYRVEECSSRKELGFWTFHKHASSGREVLIRHIGINVHWDPQDV